MDAPLRGRHQPGLCDPRSGDRWGRCQGASLGYAAFAPSAGRGYMTEGLAAALGHAFEDLRLHRLGFRYEELSPSCLYIDGVWRDHERWSITAPSPWTPDPSLPEV
ncbi:GNAT family N-acetyltransferase [Streptomyces sp. NPDC058221]|uniref:GNAT family N-acetyltransferase n=1 Tax=Streptomyces sp. NPDC058221 TaxID=3346388 RepID=UPI0036E21622